MPLAYGYALICAVAIILAPAFLRFWVSTGFAKIAAPVAEILFVGAWINGVSSIAFTLLQGQGRVALIGKFHLAQVAPSLAVLWWLTSLFGICGAAVAWSARCVADALGMFYAARIPRADLASILFPAAFLGVSSFVAHAVGSSLYAAAAAAILTGIAVFVSASVASEEWRQISRITRDRLISTLFHRSRDRRKELV